METDDFAKGSRLLLDRGVQLAVRSEGADGASFATGLACGRAEAFRVASVEFTGAGDAFVGCMLAQLLACRREGLWPKDLPEPRLHAMVRRANALAALTTLRPGGIPALPTLAELENFLSRHP